MDLSPSLISEATSVLDLQLKALRSKKLEPLYPIVCVDTIHVELERPDRNEQRAVHVPIGIDLQGRQERVASQNRKRAVNCTVRIAPAEITRPNVGEFTTVSMVANCG